MSTGGVIAIVIGAVVVIFLAVNRGLVQSGVPVGRTGIVAPQPGTNYSGYLAATTAPQVSSILGTVLSGVNSSFHNWLQPANGPVAPAPAQAASATSPSLAAQPSGPNIQAALASGALSGWMIGPNVDPAVSYDATPKSAFDYPGLALDNSYDPNASLEFAV